MHQLSPRILFEAIDEIRVRDCGFDSDKRYGSNENFRANFIEEIDLPKWEDLYEGLAPHWSILRNLYFIKTEQERKIGIGEDFELDEIPFGECLVKDGWAFPGEVEIFQFTYDFELLVK